jgi:hypothetical protein
MSTQKGTSEFIWDLAGAAFITLISASVLILIIAGLVYGGFDDNRGWEWAVRDSLDGTQLEQMLNDNDEWFGWRVDEIFVCPNGKYTIILNRRTPEVESQTEEVENAR